MIQDIDTACYSGLRRYNGETYHHHLKRCQEKARQKLKEENYVKAISLAQIEDIGWAATFLKAPYKLKKNDDYVVNGVRLTDNSSSKAPVFYYLRDEAVIAMQLINSRFTKGSDIQEVCDYLVSDEFINAFNEKVKTCDSKEP